MKCTIHDLEVMGLNPGQVGLGVWSTSVCRTWAKNVNCQWIILRDLYMFTIGLKDNVAVHVHFFKKIPYSSVVKQVSQGYESAFHNLEVMGSNQGCFELEVHSTFVKVVL